MMLSLGTLRTFSKGTGQRKWPQGKLPLPSPHLSRILLLGNAGVKHSEFPNDWDEDEGQLRRKRRQRHYLAGARNDGLVHQTTWIVLPQYPDNFGFFLFFFFFSQNVFYSEAILICSSCLTLAFASRKCRLITVLITAHGGGSHFYCLLIYCVLGFCLSQNSYLIVSSNWITSNQLSILYLQSHYIML